MKLILLQEIYTYVCIFIYTKIILSLTDTTVKNTFDRNAS